MYDTVDEVLAHDVGDFLAVNGPDLLGRVQGYTDWRDARRKFAVWPYERTSRGEVGPSAELTEGMSSISFGFQDSLGLSRHPRVRDAAIKAIEDHGPHSASAPFWQGRNILADEAADELRQIAGMNHIVFFSTGWAAAHAPIQALVRPWDYVVFDRLCHSSLMFGAQAATQRRKSFRHNDIEHARERLAAIRADNTECGILVVTESTFSVDADYPDLAVLQDCCHEYGATLLVDSSHDLGAMGPSGTGQVGAAGLYGKVDLLVSSFSKTFAFTGGFLATRSEAVANYVRLLGSAQMFSNSITPVALGVVGEAARIVRSPEGDSRRARLQRNVERLRMGFEAAGIRVTGMLSPLVPVHVEPASIIGPLGVELLNRGLSANAVEFPAVARGTARFRFQVMSDHTDEQIDRAVEIFMDAYEACGGTLVDLDLTAEEAASGLEGTMQGSSAEQLAANV